MEQNYYLGLDVGTSSVGWAVTNENYEIIRKGGKSLWGVRLFNEAKTAKDRRIFRSARRRNRRKKWRINILQEIFAEEINKVDPGFFLRMKESKYFPEDKKDIEGNCPTLPYSLFVDNDFTDKDYHKKYPTIYHLRYELLNKKEMSDIRLVYLALHHILKHRGHFLFSGSIQNIKNFDNVFKQFIEKLETEDVDVDFATLNDNKEIIKKVLSDRNLTRSKKKQMLIKELNLKTKSEKELLSLISGCKTKINEIFDGEIEDFEKISVSFADSGYDEKEEELKTYLNEKYSVIEMAKTIYDWSSLVFMLGESESISEAKIRIYVKHKKDLFYLKKVVKKHLTKEEYDNVFVNTKDDLNNYCAYIGMTKKNGRKLSIQQSSCSYENFRKFLKNNVINKIKDDEITNYILDELEKETFLPKQVVNENSVIPNQLHFFELVKILDNLKDKSEFIKENYDKIIKIFSFRIPYYVGPLNDYHSEKFSWIVREKGRILPWNFEEKVDVEKSAEKFIKKMTNKCTYLIGEDVLPKDSLLYNKFMVLNELNNVCIDGQRLSVSLKQKIYNDLFLKNRKVTIKKLKNYLVKEGLFSKDIKITGIDLDFKASLSSYHDFKEKFSGVELTDQQKENIIINVVLFGEDKKLLSKRMKKMFPNLSDNQFKTICSLKYNGWGRLSKKFLEELNCVFEETGEVINIIDSLWNTDKNLMQLLSKDFSFLQKIEEHNKQFMQDELTYQTVNDLYVSPSVKRPIWQTILLIREIEKIMGFAPKRVFVEMAREKQESKRTVSRKSTLELLYKNCKNEEKEIIKHLESNSDAELRGDKLYLFYTQKGRCMYSQERIDFNNLWDKNIYDVDHIYPQSKVTDDSLDNRVLVKRVLNKEKGDVYPIKQEIRDKMIGFWKSLLDGGFISKEKYYRLTRNTPFSINELEGFINRQLVETRQSTKAIAEIITRTCKDSEVVYSKAMNVSIFRHKYSFTKLRDLNDLHHAKDAYLNIVVGNVYFVKFTRNASYYIKKHTNETYNLEKIFDHDVKNNKETAWNKDSISIVKNFYKRNDILITRKSFTNSGGFFDQLIVKKGKGQIPIKSSDSRLSDISKYGGYNKASGSHFALVESLDKKNKLIRTLESIPVYLTKNLKNDLLLKYFSENCDLKKPRILLNNIKIDSLIEVNGFRSWISGRSNNSILIKNAHQLLISDSETKVLKAIVKFKNNFKKNKDANFSLNDQEILTDENLLKLYDCFLNKIKNTVYNKKFDVQIKKLESGKEIFVQLDKKEKCLVLEEILHFFQCNSCLSNLSLIGQSANAGVLSINKKLNEDSKIFLINQSITGLYEVKIDLLKI